MPGQITIIYPGTDTSMLASAAMRNWRTITAPVLRDGASESLDVGLDADLSGNGGASGPVFSSPRFDRLVSCRGTGNCVFDIPRSIR